MWRQKSLDKIKISTILRFIATGCVSNAFEEFTDWGPSVMKQLIDYWEYTHIFRLGIGVRATPMLGIDTWNVRDHGKSDMLNKSVKVGIPLQHTLNAVYKIVYKVLE